MNSSIFICTIHGSYRKDLEVIRQVAELMSLVGVTVLCPSSFDASRVEEGFIKFSEDTSTPEEIEVNLLKTLRNNRNNPNYFAYFVNINGYIGPSAQATSYRL